MAFGRKQADVLAARPDVLVLQEVSRRDVEALPATFTYWAGSNEHKGLGIAVFGNHRCSIVECDTNDLPWFIPIRIDDLDLQVIAVWASVKLGNFSYVRVTHAALDRFERFIQSAPTILAGDFNSNAIWDKPRVLLGHKRLVERLGEVGLESVYHRQSAEAHGAESSPTFFLHRNLAKPYHLDYVFAPQQIAAKGSLEIGTPADWLTQSDHMPLCWRLPDFEHAGGRSRAHQRLTCEGAPSRFER